MKGDSMSSAPATGGRPRLNLAYGSWDLIWSHTHRTLLVNLGVAVTNLPLLVALSLCHQPWRHPAPFTLLLFAVGPSLAGAFGYLRRADEDERAHDPQHQADAQRLAVLERDDAALVGRRLPARAAPGTGGHGVHACRRDSGGPDELRWVGGGHVVLQRRVTHR